MSKKRQSFSENDKNGVHKEAYGHFEKCNTDFLQQESFKSFLKKLCKSETRNDVCANDSHDFVRADEFTGGLKYKCKKCGLEAISNNLTGEFEQNFFGSFVDNYSYKWHHSCMDTKRIESFRVTYGDYPIRNVTFKKRKLIYKNSINFSRDGGKEHPKDFFKSHTIILSVKQIELLRRCLNSIQIDTWETEPQIFNNLFACGFCLHDTFCCTFDNGKSFKCYQPALYSGFDKLTALIDELCGFPTLPEDIASELGNNTKIKCCGKEYPSDARFCYECGKEFRKVGKKKIKGIITACCDMYIHESSSFCPKCGKRIENKDELVHLYVPYDPEQTVWLCECLSSNSFKLDYCGNCGRKRPF